MFENVCGLALKNAAVVTTHWDVVGSDRAVELERQLVTDKRYFKPFRRAGASFFGHDNTRTSARRVMNRLVNKNPMVLKIQYELAEPGVTLEQTAAGSQLSADLDALIKKHEVEMKKLRDEMDEALKAKDEASRKELDDALAKLREDMRRTTESREQLKRPPYVPLFFYLYAELTKEVLWKFKSGYF